MKNNVVYSLIVSCGMILSFASCTVEQEQSGLRDYSLSETGDVVFQPNRNGVTEIKTKEIVIGNDALTRGSEEDKGIIGNTDSRLGYSYKVGSSIMGDYSNFASAVLDLQKIKDISDSYITRKFLNTTTMNSIAYKDYNKYLEYSSISKKVSSGFRINFLGFKLGRKKKTEETFTKLSVNEDSTVFGELNLLKEGSSFALTCTERAMKLFGRQCLSDEYLDALYGSTIGDIINKYGEYVVTGYITGAKVGGLYVAKAEAKKDIAIVEKTMQTEMNASYSWKKDTNSVNLDSLIFRKKNIKVKDEEQVIENVNIALRTYGGAPETQVVMAAQPLDDMNVNLSSWYRTVNDDKYYTIIDITDQGLCPLSGFMIEENFKRRYNGTVNGFLKERKLLAVPYIEIARFYVRTAADDVTPLYDIAPVLNTRQGDKIVLAQRAASTISDAELARNNNNDVFMQKATEMYESIKDITGLEIRTNKTAKYSSAVLNPLCMVVEFHKDNIRKYTNPKTGMLYLYDYTRKNKTAFSFYIGGIDDDYIVSDYIMEDWVDQCPEKRINIATLINSYNIIGL